MTAVETAAIVVHQLFTALWVGSVVFVTVAVLPLAREAAIDPDPVDAAVGRLLTISRTSAVVLLATGAYLLYAVTMGGELALEPLLDTGRGRLVLAMVALWLGLTGAVEVGSSRVRDGLDVGKLREPARIARPWYLAATALAGLVTAVGGLLSAGVGS